MTLTTLEKRPVSALRPHSENSKIYGDGPDQELIDSIRDKGILNPLLVAFDGRVISGHRRWLAGQAAGLTEVPCVTFGSHDELDILEALIESNRQREKTNEQIGREFATLKRVYHERDSRQGERTDISENNHGTSVYQSTEVEQPKRQAAEKIGVSYEKAHQAESVVAAIDDLRSNDRDEEAEELRTTLNTRGAAPAYKTAKKQGYIKPKERPRQSAETLTLYTHDGKEFTYPKPQGQPTFNQTQGEGISWAKWSWNPVTGCLHGCNYCYAREIATSTRYGNAWPAGFTPLFHHERLTAPANTRIPQQHTDDPDWMRVFVCSMADLYGGWVPDNWIAQVHAAMLASPQWEYLLLTKYPKRYVGLDLPSNAWVGTSVDEQKRVKLAEDAFRQIEGVKVKWLSLEPLKEPLEFSDLSMFDWIVIGAQTETRQPNGVTPAFAPPIEWVARLIEKAHEAGCKVHCKPNLLGAVNPQLPGMVLPNEYPF